jgi:hypothetical protein
MKRTGQGGGVYAAAVQDELEAERMDTRELYCPHRQSYEARPRDVYRGRRLRLY